MSSSAITTQIAQLKIGNVQNQADNSAVYSGGVWSFKNSTALTRVTITDAGNVGIGTSSPVSQLDVANDSAPTMTLRNTAQKNWNTGDAIGYLNFRIDDTSSAGARNVSFIRSEVDTGVSNGVTVASNIIFGTSGYDAVATERMRIDASGKLQINTTNNNGRVRVHGVGGEDVFFGYTAGGSGFVYHSATASGNACYFMTTPSGVVEAGKIIVNGSTTTYATSSDYRLKENVQPISQALSKVSALKPCTYTWKIDDSYGEGFIAHELAEVCPLAVVGEKDAVTEDGSIKPQSIDPAKLVALLTAAIQELSAKVDAQAAEIEALKAK